MIYARDTSGDRLRNLAIAVLLTGAIVGILCTVGCAVIGAWGK